MSTWCLAGRHRDEVPERVSSSASPPARL
jgi:hypothetical protein